MVKNVEDFVTTLLTEVFYADNTAQHAIDAILETKNENFIHFNKVIEDKNEWTDEKIKLEGTKLMEVQEQIEGDFDD